jgi:hypothetical protein
MLPTIFSKKKRREKPFIDNKMNPMITNPTLTQKTEHKKCAVTQGSNLLYSIFLSSITLLFYTFN